MKARPNPEYRATTNATPSPNPESQSRVESQHKRNTWSLSLSSHTGCSVVCLWLDYSDLWPFKTTPPQSVWWVITRVWIDLPVSVPALCVCVCAYCSLCVYYSYISCNLFSPSRHCTESLNWPLSLFPICIYPFIVTLCLPYFVVTVCLPYFVVTVCLPYFVVTVCLPYFVVTVCLPYFVVTVCLPYFVVTVCLPYFVVTVCLPYFVVTICLP